MIDEQDNHQCLQFDTQSKIIINSVTLSNQHIIFIFLMASDATDWLQKSESVWSYEKLNFYESH